MRRFLIVESLRESGAELELLAHHAKSTQRADQLAEAAEDVRRALLALSA